MKTIPPPSEPRAVRRILHTALRRIGVWRQKPMLPVLILGAGIVGAVLLTTSCSTMEGGLSIPSLIPGAQYVENKACEECHADQFKSFKNTAHGQRFLKTGDEHQEGCQSCHGPGSLHVESGGEKSKIIAGNPALCYTCHQRVRSEFSLQYRHPVSTGRMGCNDCHSMHSPEQTGTTLVSNETCYKCHQEQRGPWVFEHEPVEHDGCNACHSAHGSINARLLKERDYNLCVKCHYSTQFQSIGHYAHRRALNPQTLDPSGKLSTCSGCHRGVHGSNFSKELRTQ